VRTDERCAAMVFDGGMSVAVAFDRSAGKLRAGGVCVAVRAADLNTGTFSVDAATPPALTGASPTGDLDTEIHAASLFSNGSARYAA
jgi:hypothetical protein